MGDISLAIQIRADVKPFKDQLSELTGFVRKIGNELSGPAQAMRQELAGAVDQLKVIKEAAAPAASAISQSFSGALTSITNLNQALQATVTSLKNVAEAGSFQTKIGVSQPPAAIAKPKDQAFPINDLITIIQNTVAGAMGGSLGGPYGMAGGAMVGLMASSREIWNLTVWLYKKIVRTVKNWLELEGRDAQGAIPKTSLEPTYENKINAIAKKMMVDPSELKGSMSSSRASYIYALMHPGKNDQNRVMPGKLEQELAWQRKEMGLVNKSDNLGSPKKFIQATEESEHFIKKAEQAAAAVQKVNLELQAANTTGTGTTTALSNGFETAIISVGEYTDKTSSKFKEMAATGEEAAGQLDLSFMAAKNDITTGLTAMAGGVTSGLCAVAEGNAQTTIKIGNDWTGLTADMTAGFGAVGEGQAEVAVKMVKDWGQATTKMGAGVEALGELQIDVTEDVSQQQIETAKKTQKEMTDLAKAGVKERQAIEQGFIATWTQAWDRGYDALNDMIYGFMMGQKDVWSNFAESLKSIFFNALSSSITNVIKSWTSSLFSGLADALGKGFASLTKGGSLWEGITGLLGSSSNKSGTVGLDLVGKVVDGFKKIMGLLGGGTSATTGGAMSLGEAAGILEAMGATGGAAGTGSMAGLTGYAAAEAGRLGTSAAAPTLFGLSGGAAGMAIAGGYFGGAALMGIIGMAYNAAQKSVYQQIMEMSPEEAEDYMKGEYLTKMKSQLGVLGSGQTQDIISIADIPWGGKVGGEGLSKLVSSPKVGVSWRDKLGTGLRTGGIGLNLHTRGVESNWESVVSGAASYTNFFNWAGARAGLDADSVAKQMLNDDEYQAYKRVVAQDEIAQQIRTWRATVEQVGMDNEAGVYNLKGSVTKVHGFDELTEMAENFGLEDLFSDLASQFDLGTITLQEAALQMKAAIRDFDGSIRDEETRRIKTMEELTERLKAVREKFDSEDFMTELFGDAWANMPDWQKQMAEGMRGLVGDVLNLDDLETAGDLSATLARLKESMSGFTDAAAIVKGEAQAVEDGMDALTAKTNALDAAVNSLIFNTDPGTEAWGNMIDLIIQYQGELDTLQGQYEKFDRFTAGLRGGDVSRELLLDFDKDQLERMLESSSDLRQQLGLEDGEIASSFADISLTQDEFEALQAKIREMSDNEFADLASAIQDSQDAFREWMNILGEELQSLAEELNIQDPMENLVAGMDEMIAALGRLIYSMTDTEQSWDDWWENFKAELGGDTGEDSKDEETTAQQAAAAAAEETVEPFKLIGQVMEGTSTKTLQFKDSLDGMAGSVHILQHELGRTAWALGEFQKGNGWPVFHSGGLVQGPIGADVPILAQAGEYVLSRSDVAAIVSGASGGSKVNNYNINVAVEGVSVDDPYVRQQLAEAIRSELIYIDQGAR